MIQLIYFLFLLPLLAGAELVHVNKADLYVHSIGRGMPIIVVHGGPGLDQGSMRPQLDTLSVRNKVIFYDQRCCGFSTNESSDPITIKQYVQDLEGLRVAMHLDRIVLLGHSWGAHLAMRYAIEYPSHVAGLILLSPLPASSEGVEAAAKAYQEKLVAYEDVLSRIRDSKPFAENNPSTKEAYYMMVFSSQVHEPRDAKKINFNFTEDSAVSFDKVSSDLTRDLQKERFDLHPQLAKISAPTLIIRGHEDYIPAETAKSIQKAIPNAVYVELPETGHFPYVEKTDETVKAITAFLTDHELTGLQK